MKNNFCILLLIFAILASQGIVLTTFCKPNSNGADGCNVCPADSYGNNYCQYCSGNYFLFRSQCVPCKPPCQYCSIDLNMNPTKWANQIGPFWNNKFQDALTTQTAPNPLPAFMNNFNFNTMSQTQMQTWAEAYYFYKSLNSQINTALRPILFEAVNLVQSTLSVAPENRWKQFASFVNQKLNLNWSYSYFLEKIDNFTANSVGCISSFSPFYIDAATQAALPCNKNCQTCSNSTYCTQCSTDYPLSLTTATHTCVPCNVVGCERCLENNPSQCSNCVPSRTLVNGACLMCGGDCLNCYNSPTNCSYCLYGLFALTADSQGNCHKCTSERCMDCSATNNSQCTVCQNFGESPINGVCTKCPQNCAMCTSGGICGICFYGYGLVNNVCQKCSTGCLNCFGNSSQCLVCFSKFYLDQGTSQCKLCEENIDFCRITPQLLGISQKLYNYVMHNSNFARCRPGCQFCSPLNPQICLRCKYFYYLNAGSCTKCLPGCKICSDQTTCSLCALYSHYINGQCQSCSGNCLECNPNSLTQCYSCKNGYSLASDKTCSLSCPANCLNCQITDNTKCVYCKAGFVINDNYECVKCQMNCYGTCDFRNVSDCLRGVFDFQVNLQTYQYQWPVVWQKAQGCINFNGNNCVDVHQGYELVLLNGVYSPRWKCLYPCQTCSSSSCLTCKHGYTLNNGKCIADVNCAPNCDYCVLGSYKDPTSSNCLVCSLSSCGSCPNNICQQCNQGYYLANSICVVCPPQCKTCYDAKTCQICNKGYTKQYQTQNGNGIYSNYVCVACDPTCLTCMMNRERCMSCQPGLVMNGTRCIGQFSVGYNYHLNTVYSSFLSNSQSQNFVEDVARAAGCAKQDVFIRDIKQGSTIVSGIILSNSQSNAQSMTAQLNSYTGTVAGAAVLTSSAIVIDNTISNNGNNNTINPQKSTPTSSNANIGLIIGVTIGGTVAVIFITLLSYWLYKKHHQIVPESKPPQPMMKDEQPSLENMGHQ